MPRSADTIATCGLALKLYEDHTGNPSIQQLTRSQGESFRTWLQTLPSSSKTARDRLIWVRALLRYASEDLEWIPRNPWAGLDMPFKTESKRRPWTSAELKLFFSQELHTAYKLPKDKKAGADAAYWIPLLGLYTGARLGELAQLRVADVQTSSEIPMLSIADEEDGQSVKTEAGIRLVPIHSELIRLGFLDYVEALRARREALLWPRLPIRKGRTGGYFSQWFGTFRKALGFGPHPDFHCFRHTVRTMLAEAEIQESTIDLLLGHEVTGSTGTRVYTHRSNGSLQKAIEKLRYPALPRSILDT
jgi:integrase